MGRGNARVDPGRAKARTSPAVRLSGKLPLTDGQKAEASRYLVGCNGATKGKKNTCYCCVVAHVVGRKIRGISRQDLHQAAYEGLADAVRMYDPGRGVTFATYAYRRMRGACQDMLRTEGLVRYKKRRDRPEFRYVAIDRDSATSPHSTDVSVSTWLLPPSGDPVPGATLESDDAFEWMIRPLGDRGRAIFRAYYGPDELLMSEIGATVGVSPSRVSQDHDRHLGLLRDRLDRGPRRELFGIRSAS